MAKPYAQLKAKALAALGTYMDSLPPKNQEILAYWVNDYVSMLQKENSFTPEKLIRYKRGAVVKAHLGYRVGSEEGGLHYAIVLDQHNELRSSTVTVIPLTSIKPGTDISNLHRSKLPLGNEIYTLLFKKISDEIDVYDTELQSVSDELKKGDLTTEQVSSLNNRIKELKIMKNHYKQMISQFMNMKAGSIALIGQITTISKLRIYDPLYKHDTLSGIRVSSETLDKIDKKIQELYGKPT